MNLVAYKNTGFIVPPTAPAAVTVEAVVVKDKKMGTDLFFKNNRKMGTEKWGQKNGDRKMEKWGQKNGDRKMEKWGQIYFLKTIGIKVSTVGSAHQE